MRYLGVDYGDTRTGLAVSDLSGMLASGIGQVSCGGMRRTAERVAEEAKRAGAGAIVVGYPKNMNGTEGPRCEVVRAFAELLREELARVYPESAPEIIFFDERLSTAEAHRILNMTDTRGKKRKNVIDTLSAQIILQDFLDSRR